jgi:hypothetical protein
MSHFKTLSVFTRVERLSGRGLFEIQFGNLPGGTEESHEKPQDNPCPSRDWNRKRLERYRYAHPLGAWFIKAVIL